MKWFLWAQILPALLISPFAWGESYFNCRAVGASDAAALIPAHVYLDESGQWTMYEDGRIVPGVNFGARDAIITATFQRRERGETVSYTYTFDESRCYGEGGGSATLSKKLSAPAGSRLTGLVQVNGIYDCTCAKD